MLTAFITAVGVGGYNYFNSEEPPQPKIKSEKNFEIANGIGIINFERLQEYFGDGDRLNELQEREERLQIELMNAMKPIIITPPQIEEKPFDDSIWQKNAQTIISQAAEIETRKKKAAEDYRKATEAEYLKKRDELNNKFLNELLNIDLKLRDSDVLRLTAEEIKELQNRQNEIRIERNQVQRELIEQWTQEIYTHAEEAIKDDVERLRVQAAESQARITEEAKRSQLAAQERNKMQMEQAQKEMIARQENRQFLIASLQEVRNEQEEIENKLFDKIGDLTAKLAVIHKLKLILMTRDLRVDEKVYKIDFANDLTIENVSAFPKSEDTEKISTTGAGLVAVNDAIDLTDELIEELKKQALFEK